jgi:DNA-directed RNA polymerase subunit alpha
LSEIVSPQIECAEISEKYGRFVTEPLETGFSITLGNALRRVLLSSLPGTAVTWIMIEGLQHEFSTIPGIKEDTIEFLLNVKAIRLRSLFPRAGKLTLEAMGEGRVLAGDIEPSADFEVVNPDLHLATLDSPDAKLVVEFNVEQGKGYLPAGHGNGLPMGAISVDAIFTPIRKVNYTVEPTRVGQVSGYERLVLEVWTDGTISPIEAVSQSAQILIEQFQLFYELASVPLRVGEKQPRLPISVEQYNTPIEQLGLSVRTFNCLKRAGITKVGELFERSEEELLTIRNFGLKALEEVQGQLRALGFISEETRGEVGEEPREEVGEEPREEF